MEELGHSVSLLAVSAPPQTERGERGIFRTSKGDGEEFNGQSIKISTFGHEERGQCARIH